MKKIFSFILIILLFWGLFVSSMDLEVHGIENFNPLLCSLSLTVSLFPSEDYESFYGHDPVPHFLSLYEYEEGDFHYSDSWKYGADTRAFAYLKYSPEIYSEAKAYCLDTFYFCDVHQYEVNGYLFSEHLREDYFDSNGDQILACRIPRYFNMFGFNDQNYTLVFLGYYNSNFNVQEDPFGETGFSAFLDARFSEYFDFFNSEKS